MPPPKVRSNSSMPDTRPSLDVLGHRIAIIGPSCSGKSTLGERIAEAIDAPFVELDALYWKPNWVGSEDDEFAGKIIDATRGDSWVVAGNYRRHTAEHLWPRADAVIWLDFPLSLTTRRIVLRSWQRWRRKELLWGTNEEAFWRQLKLWNEQDSLIAYSWRNYPVQATYYAAAMLDPKWSHLRFVRLRSPREVTALMSGSDR